MADKLIENHRENAEIYKGSKVCKQKLNELLKEINIPSGLFPMVEIQEFGHNKSSGFMWITQNKRVEHKFKKMKSVVSYDTHVTAFVEKGRMKKLQGVKTKALLIWVTLSEIFIDDPNSAKITIANPTGVSRAIPFSDFEEEVEEKGAE